MTGPSARPRWLWLRVLSFTVLLPGLILVYAPYLWIIGPQRVRESWPPDAARLPALVVVAVGIAIYLVCASRFVYEGLGTPAPWDAPRLLVTGGLYRWTRNPMYVGIVAALLGEAWLFSSRFQVEFAICMAVAFHIRVVVVEEARLRAQFGADFDVYCSNVRRWGLF
jgi:protein-S-isoprenylcysteine O-methyltransferase Ste14